MSLFDTIRYPVSDSIQAEEITNLPSVIIEAIRIEMDIHQIHSGIKLAQLMRRVIREWEE